jgi:hypothetical protein
MTTASHQFLIVFFVLCLALVFVVVPIAGVVWGVRRFRKSTTGFARAMWGTGAVVLSTYLVLLGWLLFYSIPGHSRIVTQGKSPSGQEYCVVQSFQALPEPYRVSFYIRDTSGVWHWKYLEHEDLAWRSAKVEFLGDVALVSRDGVPFREIPLPTNTVDLAQVQYGNRHNYCPADFTAAQVLKHHSRD